MQTQLVKAKVNAIGKDLTGDVVQMKAGSIHIVMSSEVEYFEDRPDQFELLDNAEIITWVFNSSGVVIGLRMPDGSTKLLTDFGDSSIDLSGIQSTITSMQALITAIQATNTAQTNSINGLQTSLNGFNTTLQGLQTQLTANTNAIATISGAISALNLNQVAETSTRKHFTASIKTAIEGLMTALVTGLPVINNQVRYPCVVSVSNASAIEGLSLVHNVTCLNSTGAVFAYSLIDLTTNINDFNHTPILSNGVTLANGALTVPAGVQAFTITFTVSDDPTVEIDETYSISVGGVTATGTIVNNDGGALRSVETVSSPIVNEGGLLVYSVGLSGVTTEATTFGFEISGTANTSDYSTISFSNGVTRTDNIVNVPMGVASFTVSIQTTQDTFIEPNETLILTIGGISGTGTINNDDVVVTNVYTLSNVMEGTPVVFFVELNGVATEPKMFNFARSGTAIAGEDFINSPTFSNGVTLSGNNLTVPAGVLDFTITYQTIDDTLDEPQKTILLVIGTVNGTGVILSNDGLLAPFSTRIMEVPYYLLTSGQRSGLANVDGYAMALVERNLSGALSTAYNLRRSSNNTTFTPIGDASYCPTATLMESVVKTSDTFILSGGIDLDLINFANGPIIGFIGDEAVELTAYNSTTQRFTGVNRGVLDTVPQNHNIGARMRVYTTGVGLDPIEYQSGNVMHYKALSKNSTTTMLEANAPSSSITFNSRASRPYPPNMFRINNMYYPMNVDAGDILISWQNRNRITQTSSLVDYDDVISIGGSGTPETVVFSKNTGADNDAIVDTMIVEFDPNTNYSTSTRFGFDSFSQGIIRIDGLSAYAGRTVTSASIELNGFDTSSTFVLHVARLTKTIVLNEVNWLVAANGEAWTAPSGGLKSDIDLTSLMTFNESSKAANKVTITGVDLVALMQDLIDKGTYSLAFGNLISGGSGYISSSSGEASDGLRPIVTLTFAGQVSEVEGEAGETKTVQFFNGADMVREVIGITANSYLYTNANLIADGDYDELTVKLFSVRNGLPSWTAHEHTFTRPFTGVPTPTVINVSGGVEGANAAFTVVMSGPYTDQVDYAYTLTGTYSQADIGAITYNNDVIDNGDGTLAVPAGVSTFTMTIPIISDGITETGETIILTIGDASNTIVLSDPV